MLGHGLFKEVQDLVEQGFESSQSMQAIGYKELVPVVKVIYRWMMLLKNLNSIHVSMRNDN